MKDKAALLVVEVIKAFSECADGFLTHPPLQPKRLEQELSNFAEMILLRKHNGLSKRFLRCGLKDE